MTKFLFIVATPWTNYTTGRRRELSQMYEVHSPQEYTLEEVEEMYVGRWVFLNYSGGNTIYHHICKVLAGENWTADTQLPVNRPHSLSKPVAYRLFMDKSVVYRRTTDAHYKYPIPSKKHWTFKASLPRCVDEADDAMLTLMYDQLQKDTGPPLF
jgi:hypothetical protein